MKGTTHISQLPVQLLARVLRCLDLDERLGSCALVCSTWQQAAVLTVEDISLDGSPLCPWNWTHKVDAVSRWLAVHASAQISSIKVVSPEIHPLALPLQHLCGLKKLDLCQLEVTAVDSTGINTALFDHPALAGLTHLDLVRCNISVQGLKSCSALQYFSLAPYTAPWMQLGSLSAELAALSEAIPRLQQLTSLCLTDCAVQDAVLEQVSALSRLQQLSLRHGACTAAAFRSLPSSLTQLDLGRHRVGVVAVADEPNVVFSPSSTPGLCHLPALQELIVDTPMAASFDVALLTALTQLTKLKIAAPLVAAAGGPTLVVLSALTQLQQLQLDLSNVDVAPTPADHAAVTASQQLTELHVWDLDPGFEHALFSPARQLPHLLVLHLPLVVLRFNAPSMVAACPALQRLKLWDHGGINFAEVPEVTWAASLVALTGLSGLRTLEVDATDARLGQQVATALARLTGLEALHVEGVEQSFIGGAMRLTALSRLTELEVSEFEERFCIEAINQAPAGSPPDVWSQLPGCVWDEAVASVENLLPDDNEELHPLLRVLTDGIDHSWQQQEQLQQRVHELEQQVAQQQAGGPSVADDQSRERILEQQVAAQQAQMAVLQAQVATLQQQMAAMLESRR